MKDVHISKSVYAKRLAYCCERYICSQFIDMGKLVNPKRGISPSCLLLNAHTRTSNYSLQSCLTRITVNFNIMKETQIQNTNVLSGPLGFKAELVPLIFTLQNTMLKLQ